MKHLLTLIRVMIGLQFSVTAQNTPINNLQRYIKNIQAFNYLFPQEKVYLHFDNTGYFLGETIWFKAYVVTADSLRQTDLSKVLYVELLTPNGECLETKKLKIENGQCHGDFFLDRDYHSGFYEIRAYTRSMLNFGDDCIYSRVFPLYNAPDSDDFSQKEMDYPDYSGYKRVKTDKRAVVNIDFYPEGGYLVKGLPCKIAFKATGKKGENIDLTGTVIGSPGSDNQTFSTKHQGMGSFMVTPGEEKLQAKVNYLNHDYYFDLPEAIPSGYVLTTNNFHTSVLQLLIQKTSDIANKTTGVSVTSRGRVCFFTTISPEQDIQEVKIPKETLPEGVNSVTLFNDKGEVLAERLFFISRIPSVKLNCIPDKRSYKALDKVRLDFDIRDGNKNPIETSFSLSVRDAGSSTVNLFDESIQTNLLLGSDLRGYIEQPAYYFESYDTSHQQALDLLMMTQGWRRYSWKRMSRQEAFEVKHPIEESLLIKGSVKKAYTEGNLSGIKVNYFMTQADAQGLSGTTITDKEGNFVFLIDENTPISGKWELMLQTYKGHKEVSTRIPLDRVFSPPCKPYSYYETSKDDITLLMDTTTDRLNQSIEDLQFLKEVVVKKKKRVDPKPHTIFYVDKEINRLTDEGKLYPSTIESYLSERDNMFEHNLSKYSELDVRLCYNNYPYNIDIKGYNIEIVNEIRLYRRKEAWMSIISSDCLQNTFQSQYANPQSNLSDSSSKIMGVALDLKKDRRYLNIPKGTRLTYFEGYSQVKEFANTVDREPEPGDMDTRRTLYWNPNVRTNQEGKASVEFRNNSTGNKILIQCEGIFEGQPFNHISY